MTVSVIIPVHNAEKFFVESVLSVLNQINNNDEIILVENGSDDNSPDLCREYAKKFNNIRTVSLGKVGVSVARNEGVKLARNEWITFVDADDKMLGGALDCISDKNIPADAEIIIAGYSRDEHAESHFDGKYKPINSELLARGVLRFAKYKKRIQAVAPIDDYNNWASWGKFYKRSFLTENDIAFPDGISLSEDTAFCFQAYCAAKHVYGINSVVYYYRPNEQSAIHGYKKWLVDNNEQLINKLEEYRNIRCYDKSWARDFAALYVSKTIDICNAMRDERYGETFDDKLSKIKGICRLSHIKKAISICSFKSIVNGKKNNIFYGKGLLLLKLKWYKKLIL